MSFTNAIYQDIAELLPDNDWKSIVLPILRERDATFSVNGGIFSASSPMMLVLFDIGRIKTGLTCSWGLRNRDPYLFFAANYGGTVREEARTAEQFMYYWTMHCEGDSEAIAEMGRVIGMPDSTSVVESFRADRLFQRSLQMCASRPLSILREEGCENMYDGQAPCLKNLNEQSVRTWTVPETNSEPIQQNQKETLLPAVLNSGFAPPWFLTEDQQTVFYKLLRAGDHQGAWMSLNSSQWMMEDARRAILELAKEVERPLFKEFARAWVALPFPDDWLY